MRKSYIIAFVLAVGVAGWIGSGFLGEQAPQPTAPQSAEIASAKKTTPLPKVRVLNSVAQDRVNQLVLLGRTEASRSVSLKAQTSGRVVKVGATKGDAVKEGDVIVLLSNEDRDARLREAKALVSQRAIEYQAAKELSDRNFRSKTQLAQSAALLDAAKAQLERIEIDISHTTVRAPFDGVLNARPVEIGDFLDVGDPVATVVDLTPILVVGSVTEQEVAHIHVGARAVAKLVTGHEITGRIRYVSSVASGTTRTFEIEMEAENSDHAVVDGVTAELRLNLDTAMAHIVSPAVLTLSDTGVVGIKAVDADNIVRFYPVEILDDTADGMWLGGLPERLTLITVGQEFVQPGQKVVAVPRDGAPVSKLEDRES